MCAKKVRQLEELVSEKDYEISSLNTKIQELSARVTEYQSREAVVVDALAEAQNTARRIVEEAQQDASDIRVRIQAEKEQLDKEKQQILSCARQEAECLLGKARADVSVMLVDAKRQVREYEAKREELERKMRATVEAVAQQASLFRGLLDGDESEELQTGFEEKPCCRLHTAEMPTDYQNPADLMHSIYSLQGRKLPTEEEANTAPYSAPMQQTETQSQTQAQAECEVQQDDKPAEDEHMWTVDEILNTELGKPAATDAEFSGEVDIDTLIDSLMSKD